MKSGKRSIRINGHKTSVHIEDSFWTGLKEIADFRRVSVSELVATIAATRKNGNLSSATRIFVLEYFQNKSKRADLPHSDRVTSGEPKLGPTDR